MNDEFELNFNPPSGFFGEVGVDHPSVPLEPLEDWFVDTWGDPSGADRSANICEGSSTVFDWVETAAVDPLESHLAVPDRQGQGFDGDEREIFMPGRPPTARTVPGGATIHETEDPCPSSLPSAGRANLAWEPNSTHVQDSVSQSGQPVSSRFSSVKLSRQSEACVTCKKTKRKCGGDHEGPGRSCSLSTMVATDNRVRYTGGKLKGNVHPVTRGRTTRGRFVPHALGGHAREVPRGSMAVRGCRVGRG